MGRDGVGYRLGHLQLAVQVPRHSAIDHRNQNIDDAGGSGGMRPRELRCRGRGSECGSTIVEFALILILLMTMIVGGVDFGRALYAYHFVAHAAKSAARWAAVNGATCGAPSASCESCDNSCNGTAPMNNGPASSGDISTYVTNLAPQGISTANLTTTATWNTNSNTPAICSTTDNYPGCIVQVQVSYQFNFLFPLVSNKTLTLSSTSEMVIVH
jgi:Flp pilus assembly protein TadG